MYKGLVFNNLLRFGVQMFTVPLLPGVPGFDTVPGTDCADTASDKQINTIKAKRVFIDVDVLSV